MSSSLPLHFTVAWNSGEIHHTVLLFGFKKIISQQLPMMPVDYIIRILLDRNHRCLLAIQLPEHGEFHNSPEKMLEHCQVVGGICFRPFHSQGFAEIVFLAVEESNKHRGIGTLVMNQLKEHVKTEEIKFFLTYADNTAIGYFVKQGFTKKKTMVRSRWDGYIKDYVRSTLMECKILYNVNYLTFKRDLARQKALVMKKIKTLSKAHIVRAPLNFGKRSSLNIEEIPGVLEAGWRNDSGASGRLWNVDNSLTAQMGRILKIIKSMKQSWPFLKPVDPLEAPGYSDVIENPMDLSTIEKKLNEGKYQTKEEFLKDFDLIIDNCIEYNGTDTVYSRCAVDIKSKLEKLVRSQAEQI